MMKEKRRFFDSTLVKGIIILVLTVLLLIPITMVQSLIEERSSLKSTVTEEISSVWGGQQSLLGPILVVPYEKKSNVIVGKDANDKDIYSTTTEYAYFMPDTYNVSSELKVEERSRSIYNVLVYQSHNQISGTFDYPNPSELDIKEEMIWENAVMVFQVPHMQGIKNKIDFVINGKSYKPTPGITTNAIISSGMSVKVPLNEMNKEKINFSFNLDLNGSEKFKIASIGKQNTIKMNSDWNIVSFIGDTFPQREIDENGFRAEWSVFDYSSRQPQMWTTGYYTDMSLYYDNIPSVGVELKYSVDQYQMSMRSAKYAIMFILLTFAIFFLVEIVSKTRIHPVQYTLVSFALILFYTLLIALSEHIGFQLAYLIAAIAVVLMITLYARTIFKKLSHALAMGAFVTLIYIYLYVILQLENMALLIGAVGLFIALGAIMYALRKVNWYKEENDDQENIPKQN